jgi:CubicO group peptidase (beta-lactamase class C family)
MKKILITVILLYSLTELTAQTTYPKEIQAQIKKVENNLAGRIKIDGKADNILDRMAHFKVKGLSMAVVQDYKIIWAKGYGWADEKEKRPVTTATLFKPGSISKSLNAIGALKLVQDNKIDLYEDINKYLKSWQFPYDSLSKGKKITLANLLSHTGGLSVYGGFPGYAPKSKIPTLAEVLDGKEPANTPPVRSLFEPGLQFQYSGGGTLISQLMITDVSHQNYETFMYEKVLKPMGMVHSFYSEQPLAGDKLKNIATGYLRDGLEVASRFYTYPEQAAMGLWTTPTDLCKYIVETQLAYEGKSSKVLNQEMTRLRLSPYIDKLSGLGVFLDDRNGAKYFLHDAGNEGFRGVYLASVEGGNGVVIFVNSDNGDIILEVLNSVTSVYNWKGYDKPASINTVKLPEALAQKYVGMYVYDGRLAEVTKKQDGLYFWTEGQDVKMYFTSDKDFVNIEFPSQKSFITDNSGNVTGYARRVNEKEYPPATKVLSIDSLRTVEGQINNFGWHLLENKRFDEAIAFFNKGIALEPNDVNARGNLAHCYLFKNEFDKAMQLYQAYLAQKPNEESSLKAVIKGDFDFFRKNGFDGTLIDKASMALHL